MAMCRALFRDKKPEEAWTHGRLSIGLSPEDVDAYAIVLRGLLSFGMLEEASNLIEHSVHTNAENGDFLRRFAISLVSSGLAREALKPAEQLAKLKPIDSGAWTLVTRARLAARELENAVESGLLAIEYDSNSADAHVILASVYGDLNKTAEALLHYRRAIELNPEDSVAYCALASILQQEGEFDEARSLIEKSVELRPANGYGHFALLRARRVTTEDKPLLEKLDALSLGREASLLDRSYLQYAVAKGREDLRQYEEAMLAYDSANAIGYKYWFGDQAWNHKEFARGFDRTIEFFTTDFCLDAKTRGIQAQTPVFIVGMPRSGTTLVEQIISSHEDVSAAGELDFWNNRMPEAVDVNSGKLDGEKLCNLSEEYLRLLGKIGPHSTRVTDKMPHNFAVLGVLNAAFQNVRIIHVRRNVFDNCLSIYTTAFGRPPIFTMRRDDIAFAYRQYRRIMAHWRSALGKDNLLEVNYEDLIANREEVTRRMIDFVDIPWSDACLHPDANERAVLTASMWQVRQPVYTTSVDRWHRFKPWLGEFNDLADLMREDFKLM